MLDALLAVHERVQEWPRNADSCGAQGDSLEDIRASLEATVDEDLEVLEGIRE